MDHVYKDQFSPYSYVAAVYDHGPEGVGAVRVGVLRVVGVFVLRQRTASSRDELRAPLRRPRCSRGVSATCLDELLEDVVGLCVVLECLQDSHNVRVRVTQLEEALHLVLLTLHVCVCLHGFLVVCRCAVSPLLTARFFCVECVQRGLRCEGLS